MLNALVKAPVKTYGLRVREPLLWIYHVLPAKTSEQMAVLCTLISPELCLQMGCTQGNL